MTTNFAPDPEKQEALAEFAAGAGHEINNPLATIIGRAQQLLRDETDPQRRNSLSIIAAQAYRVRDMIGDVMTFARPPQPVLQDVDLNQWLPEVISQASKLVQGQRCEIMFEFDADLHGRLDPVQLAIVIHELIRNAAQALQPAGGEIGLTAGRDEAGEIVIAVSDHGQGFSDLEREHAFDPFFSGRQAGRGLGFGLCKVWQIAQMHGGSIRIESAVGGPTMVTVRLPQTGYNDSSESSRIASEK